jgi:predicted AAA+ superfamily ATPase
MIARSLAKELITALGDTPVVLLNGPRQCGKSTLAQSIVDEHPARYLTLDDAGVLAAAQHDPQGFLAGFDGPVILDEVQRAPELFLAIKATVDRDPRPGRFLLTGSADVLLLPRVADSLAGRMEILTLWPFSQGEIEGVEENFPDRAIARRNPVGGKKESREATISRVIRGGYPAVVSRSTYGRRRAWFASYLTAILQRDVRSLANIEGLTEMPRLLSLLASRSGQLLNFAEIASSAAIPQTTLKRYMTLPEITFLVQELRPWLVNLGKRLVKSPKVLLNDTGLISYLLGLREDHLNQESTLLGPLLENFVVMELRKQITWSRSHPALYHFRLHTGQEVDIVLDYPDGTVVGIEVKASATATPGDFRGIYALKEAAGKRFRRGLVLYLGAETIPFAANLFALPVSSLWSAG